MTMPIIIYHFHSIGFSGVAANIFAIPVMTFVLMPLLFLQVILWIFDIAILESVLFYSVDIINNTALFFAGYAHYKMPILPPVYLFLSLLSVTCITIGNKILSYFGIVLWLCIMVAILFAKPPTFIIKKQGEHIGFVDKQNLIILSTKRSSYFLKKLWQQVFAADKVIWIKKSNIKETKEELILFLNSKNYDIAQLRQKIIPHKNVQAVYLDNNNWSVFQKYLQNILYHSYAESSLYHEKNYG